MAVTTGSALSRDRGNDASRAKAYGHQLMVLAHAWFFGAYAEGVNPRRTARDLHQRMVSNPGGRVRQEFLSVAGLGGLMASDGRRQSQSTSGRSALIDKVVIFPAEVSTPIPPTPKWLGRWHLCWKLLPRKIRQPPPIRFLPRSPVR
jgi:hypothetical protein